MLEKNTLSNTISNSIKVIKFLKYFINIIDTSELLSYGLFYEKYCYIKFLELFTED